MSLPCPDNAQKAGQRERADSKGQEEAEAIDNTIVKPDQEEEDKYPDLIDSDSDDDVAALLRPLTPTQHLVNRSGPTPTERASARGRREEAAIFVPLPMMPPADPHPLPPPPNNQ